MRTAAERSKIQWESLERSLERGGSAPDVILVAAGRRRADGTFDVEIQAHGLVADPSGRLVPDELADAMCRGLRSQVFAEEWHDLGINIAKGVVGTALDAVRTRLGRKP